MLKLFLSNWRDVLYYRLYHGLYHGLYHVPVMMWSCHGHVLPASPHPAMRLKQSNMYFPHKLGIVGPIVVMVTHYMVLRSLLVVHGSDINISLKCNLTA